MRVPAQVRHRVDPPAAEATYSPSGLSIPARLSSWCASAIQLREMFVSTADRRSEFLGSAARILHSAAYALHCSTEGICACPLDPVPHHGARGLKLKWTY